MNTWRTERKNMWRTFNTLKWNYTDKGNKKFLPVIPFYLQTPIIGLIHQLTFLISSMYEQSNQNHSLSPFTRQGLTGINPSLNSRKWKSCPADLFVNGQTLSTLIIKVLIVLKSINLAWLWRKFTVCKLIVRKKRLFFFYLSAFVYFITAWQPLQWCTPHSGFTIALYSQ